MKNKAIIYDNTCPLCCWYTGAFVRQGMLKEENRISFDELEKGNLVEQIDLTKSKNEIPLVDLEGGDTLYGIDSLVALLKDRFPFIPWFMEFRLVDVFIRKLYKFVSYNRRVIAPSAKKEMMYDCKPDFNLKYRLLYVLFALGIGMLIWQNFIPLFFIVLGMALVGIAALFFQLEVGVEMLGQFATVAFIGALSMIPSFFFKSFALVNGGIALLLMLGLVVKRFKILAYGS